MGWCDDVNSQKYNKLIKANNKIKHEKLFQKRTNYDLIIPIKYNTKKIKKNKGSAIFIHVAKKKYSKTKGCVAVNKINLLRIVRDLDIKSKVKISNRK